MKYLNKTFKVSMQLSKEASKRYDNIFRKPLKVKIIDKINEYLYRWFLK